MEEIYFKEYEETDLDGCVDLLSRTFPERSDKSTFQWRFQTQNRKKSIIIVAKHEERIISFNSWIPWEFSYNGKTYLGYQSGESATIHEYRGKGIWEKVFKLGQKVALEQGIDFLFGFPNEMSYGGAIKAGYFPVGTFFFYLRPIIPFKKTKNNFLQSFSDISSFSILSQDNTINPEISNEYCTWRYIDNTKDYDILEYSEKTSWAIFFIRSRKWKGLNEAILLDCQFNNYNDLFVDNAFKYFDNALSRRALYARTFFNEHSDRGGMLKKHFFLKAKSKHETLMVKPISERIDLRVLLNWFNWDIMPHCVDEY